MGLALRQVASHVPFATMNTLHKRAERSRACVQVEMGGVFDRPMAWVLNSLGALRPQSRVLPGPPPTRVIRTTIRTFAQRNEQGSHPVDTGTPMRAGGFAAPLDDGWAWYMRKGTP